MIRSTLATITAVLAALSAPTVAAPGFTDNVEISIGGLDRGGDEFFPLEYFGADASEWSHR